MKDKHLEQKQLEGAWLRDAEKRYVTQKHKECEQNSVS